MLKANAKSRSPNTVHLDRAAWTCVGALLTFGCNYGLQILAFPPLLPSVTVGCIICRGCDLFCFVYGGLFNVTSIHDNAAEVLG